MNVYLSCGEVCSFRVIIQSLLPAQHVAIMSTHSLDCATFRLCFHLVRFWDLLSIILVCRDYHHAVLLHLYTFFKENITAFSFSFHAHPMARHTLSAFSSYRNGSFISTHILLTIMLVLVWYSTHVSSFLSFQAEQLRHYFRFPPF